MPARRRRRLDPAIFELPAEKLRAGHFTDHYSTRAREVLVGDRKSPKVLVQVTCAEDAFLGGIDEAIAILKTGVDDWSTVAVHALFEGDRVDAYDPVLTIEGPYEQFAHLDSAFLGALTRATGIVSGMHAYVEAARPREVMLFPARDDHWRQQAADGYAATVAGVSAVSTPAQASWSGAKVLETVSHSLIATYGGDTVRATTKLAERLPDDVQLIAVVDYKNDCVGTSVAVARALQHKLWGVRLDTSPNMVDKSILPQMGDFDPRGVNPQLVWNVRDALDGEGFGDVKIVASGAIDLAKINFFDVEGVPVDAFAVSAASVALRIPFTADIVQVEGKAQSKVGRELRENARLERVK